MTSCFIHPAMAAIRQHLEDTLEARCTRLRAVRVKDSTGATKYSYTPYLTDRPCRIIIPALTPDVRGIVKLTPNVDVTFLFAVDEPSFDRTERILYDNRTFEVTAVGVIQPTTFLLKILTKEVV